MKPIILTFLFVLSINGETLISGIIEQNEWWTKDKSPYIITNDIVIMPKVRLVIDPGVEILVEKPTTIPHGIEQFDRQDSFSVSIRILGALFCKGRPMEQVTIKPRYKNDDIYSSWYGIVINSNRSDEINIEYLSIIGASTAIKIDKGMPVIRNSTFQKNNIAIKITNKSTPRIIQSLFTDNFLAAIRVVDANPYLYNNIIAYNHNIGVWSDKKSELVFKYNCVYGNDEKNYKNTDPLLGVNSQTNKNNDSVDYAFNLNIAPLFVGSTEEKKVITQKRKVLEESTLEKPDNKALISLNEAQSYKPEKLWELSRFSPCINAGNQSKRFREPDQSLPDLGIWGGPEFVELRK